MDGEHPVPGRRLHLPRREARAAILYRLLQPYAERTVVVGTAAACYRDLS